MGQGLPVLHGQPFRQKDPPPVFSLPVWLPSHASRAHSAGFVPDGCLLPRSLAPGMTGSVAKKRQKHGVSTSLWVRGLGKTAPFRRIWHNIAMAVTSLQLFTSDAAVNLTNSSAERCNDQQGKPTSPICLHDVLRISINSVLSLWIFSKFPLMLGLSFRFRQRFLVDSRSARLTS